MIDERIQCIVLNAFNGFSDTTGDDAYGYSVAWVDIQDHMDPDGLDHHELYPYSDDVTEYVSTHPDVTGYRYFLAYWDADGSRYVVAHDTRDDGTHSYAESRAGDIEAGGFPRIALNRGLTPARSQASVYRLAGVANVESLPRFRVRITLESGRTMTMDSGAWVLCEFSGWRE